MGWIIGFLFRKPLTPWNRWLVGVIYAVVAIVMLSLGRTDREALTMGVSMIALGVAWIYFGAQRISRGIEWALERFGAWLRWAVPIGILLACLYFLVRFVKWAWMND